MRPLARPTAGGDGGAETMLLGQISVKATINVSFDLEPGKRER